MINSIIFLDIDGVLNTKDHLKHQKLTSGEISNKVWNPIACKHIAMLCEYYKAGIVIISSWRNEYTINQLREFFISNKIPQEYILGVTDATAPQHDGRNYCRGHEIDYWLQNSSEEIMSYVIIDDSSNFLDSQRDHVVRVDKNKGFSTKEAVTQASNILEINFDH